MRAKLENKHCSAHVFREVTFSMTALLCWRVELSSPAELRLCHLLSL